MLMMMIAVVMTILVTMMMISLTVNILLGGEENQTGDGDDHIDADDDRKFTSCQLFVRKVTKNKSIMKMIDYSEMVVMMVMIILTGTFADCKKVTIIMIIVIVVMKSVLVNMKMLNI